MKEKKTRKLTCNITGKILFASKNYYAKKVEKAGSEEELHGKYICREAKTLIKKGMHIDDIRQTIESDNLFAPTMTNETAQKLINSNTLRIAASGRPIVGVIKTDSDVKTFIKNILSE